MKHAILSLTLYIMLLLTFSACSYTDSPVTPIETQETAEAERSQENLLPQDETDYEPTQFAWDKQRSIPEAEEVFIAGKYVRADSIAVLYIDYKDTSDEFTFELAVNRCPLRSRYETIGVAKTDLSSAYSLLNAPTHEFYTPEPGVIELYSSDFDESYASPDGVYYITRALHTTTPTPVIIYASEENE